MAHVARAEPVTRVRRGRDRRAVVSGGVAAQPPVGVASDESLFQLPLLTLSVWPSWAVPESVGAAVLTGGLPATTTPVALETAWPEPAELVAVTWTRSVCPTSLEPSVSVWAVAPCTSEQSPPELEQRRHW